MTKSEFWFSMVPPRTGGRNFPSSLLFKFTVPYLTCTSLRFCGSVWMEQSHNIASFLIPIHPLPSWLLISRSYSYRITSVVSSLRLFSPKQTNSSRVDEDSYRIFLSRMLTSSCNWLCQLQRACGDDCPNCASHSPIRGEFTESDHELFSHKNQTELFANFSIRIYVHVL